MQFLSLRLLLILQVSCGAFAGGCGTENAPSCADVSWVGRLDHAQLTGAPSFSTVQIAPGDSLTIAVPVDVNTRGVTVWINADDEIPTGAAITAETAGGEVAEIDVEDTNLPTGVYVAGRIDLRGDIAPQFAQYLALDSGMPYVLSVFPAAESQKSCVTDILAPTFTVVSENSSGPER